MHAHNSRGKVVRTESLVSRKSCTWNEKKTVGIAKTQSFHISCPDANMILPKSANQSNTSLGVRRSSRKKMSVERRAALIALREAGVCIDEIQKQTGASRASIFRLARASKYPKSKNKKAGRPKKTTEEMDNFIVDNVERNRKLLPKQVQKMVVEKYGVRLSLSQIRLRLRVAGLHGAVCVRKPLLSLVNKLKRLLWAFRHRHWTIVQWKQVLWSDEIFFEATHFLQAKKGRGSTRRHHSRNSQTWRGICNVLGLFWGGAHW